MDDAYDEYDEYDELIMKQILLLIIVLRILLDELCDVQGLLVMILATTHHHVYTLKKLFNKISDEVAGFAANVWWQRKSIHEATTMGKCSE